MSRISAHYSRIGPAVLDSFVISLLVMGGDDIISHWWVICLLCYGQVDIPVQCLSVSLVTSCPCFSLPLVAVSLGGRRSSLRTGTSSCLQVSRSGMST